MTPAVVVCGQNLVRMTYCSESAGCHARVPSGNCRRRGQYRYSDSTIEEIEKAAPRKRMHPAQKDDAHALGISITPVLLRAIPIENSPVAISESGRSVRVPVELTNNSFDSGLRNV